MQGNMSILRYLFIPIGVVIACSTLFVSCNGITKNRQEIQPTYQYSSSKSPLIGGWEKAPISKELTGWLKEHDSAVIVFVTKNGEFRVSSLTGKEVPCCGHLVGTEVEGKCTGLKHITIKNINRASTIITEGSPPCVTIEIMGYLVEVDAETGEYPCRE